MLYSRSLLSVLYVVGSVYPVFFFLIFKFCLAASGLSCGMWNLSLLLMDPLVVVHQLSCSVARGILVP